MVVGDEDSVEDDAEDGAEDGAEEDANDDNDAKWATRFASNDGDRGTSGEKCAHITGQSKRAEKSRMDANSAN